MPILLALSVLAFVALLWATVSIAGYVRRSRRRRRRRAAEGEPLTYSSLASLAAGASPIVYTDVEAKAFSATNPALDPATSTRPAGPPERREALSPLTPPASENDAVATSLSSQQPNSSSARLTTAAESPVQAERAEPASTAVIARAEPAPSAATLGAPQSPRLRSFPTRLNKHTLAAVGSDGAWPRLPSVGTEYGDLSDPASSRLQEFRARIQARTR